MASTNSVDILVVSDLSKRYGGVVAVDAVDLTIGAGEIVGLVGPNGAGKTTLVDLISGSQRPTSGSVALDGQELVGSAARRARRGLARTFQHPQLAQEMSVEDNILLGRVGSETGSLVKMMTGIATGVWRGRARTDVEHGRQLAEQMGLAGLQRDAGDLTLGEQRLTEVARAIGQRPKLLLLDEPFAGADHSGIEAISRAIVDLRSHGLSVVLVDHNIDLVSALVDRMVLMQMGKVAFDGDPVECLRSPELEVAYFGRRSQPVSPEQERAEHL